MGKRILIVGGVAGGASCATRARRLSEEAEIVVFERGPYVSFANCGLPYYVGDVIKDERDLLVANVETFRERFNIEVRTENEVLSIDRGRSEIEVRDRRDGSVYRERYDALVLAPGASPVRPPIPGIDLDGIFALRTIPDSRRIREWISGHDGKRALVVGGGFIGLEMAENLRERGLDVTIVDAADQVLPPLDPEMARIVARHLVDNGFRLILGDAIGSFAPASDHALAAVTKSGEGLEADVVILGIGVRPESALAVDAGLRVNAHGGIVVDDQMRTSDARIWAVGDVTQDVDFVTGKGVQIPLAGPANRQGRVAADSILGRSTIFRGVQATSVCSVEGLVIATTGANEKTLKATGRPFLKVYLHPGHHVGYYPGARPISLKLLFDPEDGRVLGAQAVGEAGVERRIDVIAMTIQMEGSVYDLEESELCYAPQFGAAKDPVNMAGMIAANVLRGDADIAHWEDVGPESFLLDVRTAEEFADGHAAGAVNIDVNELRDRLHEVPKDREVLVTCEVGQRGYYAQRLLKQLGYRARNLSGGMKTGRLSDRARKTSGISVGA